MAMTALDMIRLIGPEFKEVDDGTIEQWIEMVSPMVSKKMFGKLYNQAIAYLVCHKMTVAGVVAEKGDADGGFGSMAAMAAAYGITSISEGSASLSFSNGNSAMIQTDGEYASTQYGAQFLQLRKMCITPIRASGEDWLVSL